MFDSATFGAGSVASGLVTHVASGRLGGGAAAAAAAEGEGEAAPEPADADAGAIEALVWHTMGSLLLGTSTGALAALQPLRASIQRAPAEAQVDGSALRRQDSVGLAFEGCCLGGWAIVPPCSNLLTHASSQPVFPHCPFLNQASKRRTAPQPAAGSPAPAPAAQPGSKPPGPAAPRGPPSGWGGEPLMTNGVASQGGSGEFYDAPGGAAMRGRGGRGLRGGGNGGGGRYGPAGGMQPYAQQKRDGAPQPGGPPGKPGGAPGQGGLPMSPEQQAHMMQAAVAAQWGMMPAAMAAPQMWRQMGYAVNAYGQMVPVTQMAPAMPGYPAPMAGAPVMPQMVPQQPGGPRGAQYAPRPAGMGGPAAGGRGAGRGGAGPGAGYNGGEGGGGRGMMGGAAYNRRGGAGAGGPPRGQQYSQQQDDSGQEDEQSDEPQQPQSGGYHHQQQQHYAQQQQSEAPARGSSNAQQGQRSGYAGGARASGDGASSSGGEHWQGEGGGGGYHGGQQHGKPSVPPPQPPAAPPLSPTPAAAPASMMARSPYGMAPVYMFPQTGMAGMTGMTQMMYPQMMYPGSQMAAFPTPGGYVMYPGAYGVAPGGGTVQVMPPAGGRPQITEGDGGRKNRGPRGGGGGAYNSSSAQSEDSGEGGYSQQGGGGYGRGGGGGGDGGHSAGGYGQQAPPNLTTLYVGNLAPTVDEDALAAQFEQFGPVERSQVRESARSGEVMLAAWSLSGLLLRWKHHLQPPHPPAPPPQIIRDRETQEPRGFGFITFSSSAPQAGPVAMQRLNGATLQGAFGGRTIRVSPSNKGRAPEGGAVAAAAAVGPPQMMMAPAAGGPVGAPR